MKLLRLVLLTAVILMGFSASALSESVLALPAKLTSIESEGFRDDVSIREVVIPDSCTQIGSYAFAGCTGLQKATIPPTVTHIGEHAFMGCDQVVIHCVKGSQAHAYARDNGLSYSLEGCVESGAVGRLSWAYMEDGELIIGGVGAIPGRPAEGEADPRPWQKYASTATKLTVETGVTQIGDYAFSEYKIKEVSFPNTLASIGECAFYRTYLQGSLVLPDSVTELGKEAFYLTFLSSVKLSAGLKRIPEGCFEGNLKLSEYSKLRSVVIPEGIETIGACAFACQSLGDVTLPSTIRVIEASAFWRSFVTSVNLPEGVTTIGAGAFYRCRLKELVLPDSLVSLGKCAFGMNSFSYVRIPPNVSGFPYAFALSEYDELYDWYEYSNVMPSPNGLTDADIADGVASISEGAFEGSLYLKRVGIPSSVTAIEAKAFRNCWGLETLVIPNSVTRIGAKAFDNCIGLVNIALPASVTEIDDTAFDNCGHLTITAQEGTYAWQWASQRGLLEPEVSPVGDFTYTLSDGGCAITGYTGNDPDIVVPNRIEGVFVTDIAANAFANQTMQSIALPAMLRTIGDAAFSNCDGLTAVDIPVYVTAIGNSAFNGCDSLESIALFDSPDRDGAYGHLETIGNGAFANCASLLRLELPNSVTSLGDDFILGDMALQYLEFGSGVKELTYSKTRLYCGSSRRRAEFDALNPALETVIIPSGVESIGEYAFSGKVFYSTDNVYYFDNCYYPNLKSVSLQGSVRIGGYAFAGARQLSDIDFNKIRSIGASAFRDCASIEQAALWLSDGEVVPESAFSGCTSLKQVSLVYGMTAIENNAFYNCDALQSVSIPSTVTSIGENAFCGCDSLETVRLREGLEAIGNGAFANCPSLLRLELPDSVTSLGDDFIKGDLALKYIRFGGGVPELTYTKTRLYTGTSYYYSSAYQSVNPALETVVFGEGVTDIGPYVFSTEWYCIPNSNNYVYNNCYFPNLKSVSLPQSLTRIGDNAFAYATALDDIVIPSGVSDVGASAFRGCTALREANIPAGVASVAESTFYGCTALETVTLSTGLKAIGNSAFYGCTALVDAALPQGLETIGNDAFNNCDALPAAAIPSSVTSVGSNAYNGCDALESLALNEGLVTIGYGAFANCASLLRLEVPDSVTELGDDFIKGDLALKHVRFGGGVPELTFRKTRLYSGSSTYYSSAYASVRPALETVEIGEGVTVVDSSAFSADYFCYANTNNYVYNNCYYPNLKSVSLPQSLTRIGDNAFAEANSLISYNIPSCTETIGTSAFKNCPGPASIVIPETTVSVGSDAFNGGTNIRTVAVQGVATQMGSAVFANCENLETVDLHKHFLKFSIKDNEYRNDKKLGKVILPPNVRKIGANAFDGCVALYDINLSDATKLMSIGSYAFRNCDALTGVSLQHVEEIGSYAFYDCNNLTTLSLGLSSTRMIGDYAFANCPTLETLRIPESTLSVGNNIIRGDTGLTHLIIDGGQRATSGMYYIASANTCALTFLSVGGKVTEIGESAFRNWTCLNEVALSGNLTAIGANAFSGCTGVTSVLTLPSGLTTLGASAFANCDGWVRGSVVIPYNVTALQGNTFAGCTGITRIVLSSKVNSIVDSAFKDSAGVLLRVPSGSAAAAWAAEHYVDGTSTWSYSIYGADASYYDTSVSVDTTTISNLSVTSDEKKADTPYTATFTTNGNIQGVHISMLRASDTMVELGEYLVGDSGVSRVQTDSGYSWTVTFTPTERGAQEDNYIVRFQLEVVDWKNMYTSQCATSGTIQVGSDLSHEFSRIQDMLPSGKYWCHHSASEDWTYNVSDQPCSCTHRHGNSRPGDGGHPRLDGSCGCNTFQGGIQCFAYSNLIAYELFGSLAIIHDNNLNPTINNDWTLYRSGSLPNEYKPGDVIRTSIGHSMVITDVSDTTVTITDCNYTVNCLIRWNTVINKSRLNIVYLARHNSQK